MRVRRGSARARYGADAVHQILDDAAVAHVAVTTDDGPLVLPMAFGRTDTELYLHGALANALLGAGTGAEVCVTVTLLDGLVIARNPFHNSMNYRCVVVRGAARAVTDPDERLDALRRITEHVVANWDTGRPPTDSELRRTAVVAVSLAEASVKVRSGDPVDEDEDLGGPHWAGTVGLRSTFDPPTPAADLRDGIEVPAAVAVLAGDEDGAPDR